MKTTRLAATGVAALMVAGAVAGTATARTDTHASAQRSATIDPADFASPKANPYFPLTVGKVFRYRGTDDGAHLRERLVVTRHTKTIIGVKARVISDVLRRADGSLAEKTKDWYADDNKGNVWYLGEVTATYKPNGQVESRAGSWQAGVHGAVAGLIMPANPRPTDAYRQEYWRGHAEDQAWIVTRHGRVTVPYGTLTHVVRSYEWSRLEKANVSVKFYAPGLGIVAEHDVSGGTESFKLVSVGHI